MERELAPDQKPTFAILVEGGMVQSVVSAIEHVLYRLIDLDGQCPEERLVADCLMDQDHIDIEVFTRDALG